MADVNSRVQKHHNALRMAGLRPFQLWVLDIRRPDFAEECLRQRHVVSRMDGSDPSLRQFMQEALESVEGWTE